MGVLISLLLSEQNSTLRNFYYNYHRTGLDNLAKADQISTKQIIASELMKLKFMIIISKWIILLIFLLKVKR